MNNASKLRRVLVLAAGMPGNGGAFLAHKAVEMEGLYIHAARDLSIYTWSQEEALDPRTKKVSVPRSLRRWFGRYVEAMA